MTPNRDYFPHQTVNYFQEYQGLAQPQHFYYVSIVEENKSPPLIEYGNFELVLITTLLMALPMGLYLAYRCGKRNASKKIGKTEHPDGPVDLSNMTPPRRERFQNQTGSLVDYDGDKSSSTKDSPTFNSRPPRSNSSNDERDNDKSSSTTSSPALGPNETTLQTKGSMESDIQMPKSVIDVSEQKVQYSATIDPKLPEHNSILERFGGEKFKADNAQVEHKIINFTAEWIKKDNKLIKQEKTVIQTLYQENAEVEPTFLGAFADQAKLTKAHSDPLPNSINFYQPVRSITYSHFGSSPPQLQAVPEEKQEQTQETHENVVRTRTQENFTVSSESENNRLTEVEENITVKGNDSKNQGPIELVKEASNSLSDKSQDVAGRSEMEKLVEKYDLPAESGKFKKIFKEVELIGGGGFGSVFKVTHRVDGKTYAVKKVKLNLGKFEELLKNSKVFREVNAMTDLHHPNIVRYATCWVEVEKNENEAESKMLSHMPEITETEEKRSKDQNCESTEKSYLDGDTFDDESKISGLEWEQESSQKVENAVISFNENKVANKRKEFKMINHTKSVISNEEIEQNSVTVSRLSNYSTTVTDPQFSSWRLYLYIQMEFCPGLSLRSYFDVRKSIDAKKVLGFFRKLLDGVRAIHSRGILHRDLKPDNIFLDHNENIKIGDFGLASLQYKEEEKRKEGKGGSSLQMSKTKSEKVGTPLYTSPEQENGGDYDHKTDIYSLGLVFYEMLQIFSTIHERHLCIYALKNHHRLSDEFVRRYPKEAELILAMTSTSPEQRPTAESLIPEIDKLIESLEVEKRQ